MGLQPQLERAGLGSACRPPSRRRSTSNSRAISTRSSPNCDGSHPKVEIESCSGGGGRVDLGILQYTDEVWPSDNTDPFDRLAQQDGFTYAYTPQVMMAWVTDSPHWLNQRATSLDLPHAQLHAGLARHRRQHHQVERRRNGHRQAPYRRLPSGAAHHRAGRSLPADLAAQRQRVLRHPNCSTDKTQSVVFAFIHSTQEGRGFPDLKLKGSIPRPNMLSPPSKAKPDAQRPQPPAAPGG